METDWGPADIGKIDGRANSVVRRWIKDSRQEVPQPDFMTSAGKPTWRLVTVRAWMAGHKPVLKEH